VRTLSTFSIHPVLITAAADTRAFGSVARKYNAWLRSGNGNIADFAYLLRSSGGYADGGTKQRYSVRPASSNAVN